MPPAEFNPYEPPKSELPANLKASKRSVTFGEVVIVAWIFTTLVAVMLPAFRYSQIDFKVSFDIGTHTGDFVLIFLAATVAPVLTVAYAIVWALRAFRKRRNLS